MSRFDSKIGGVPPLGICDDMTGYICITPKLKIALLDDLKGFVG